MRPTLRQTTAPVLTALCFALVPFSLYSQPPADKAPLDATAAAKAAEIAKPLAPADKKFIKEATEALFFELAIIDVAMRRNRPVGAGRDATWRLASQLQGDLQTCWEELSKFAAAKNEKVGDDLSGVQKRDVEEIRAVKIVRFHKEVAQALGKSGKELAQIFATPAIQHPVLKKIAATHAPNFQEHVKAIAQAAK